MQIYIKDFRVTIIADIKNTNFFVVFRVLSVTFFKYWGYAIMNLLSYEQSARLHNSEYNNINICCRDSLRS